MRFISLVPVLRQKPLLSVEDLVLLDLLHPDRSCKLVQILILWSTDDPLRQSVRLSLPLWWQGRRNGWHNSSVESGVVGHRLRCHGSVFSSGFGIRFPIPGKQEEED